MAEQKTLLKRRLAFGLALLAAVVGGMFALTVYRLAHPHKGAAFYWELCACTSDGGLLYDAYVLEERTEGFYMPMTYVVARAEGRGDAHLLQALGCVKRRLAFQVRWDGGGPLSGNSLERSNFLSFTVMRADG